MTNPEYLGLRRAICERPHDDTPRLILADWLEDNGQTEWAEFIRVQIAKATRPCHAFMYSCYEHGDTCRCDTGLNAREDELIRFNTSGWLQEGLPEELLDGFGTWRQEWTTKIISKRSACRDLTFHRGMINEISLSLKAFLKHAKDLFTEHPITKVVITGVCPLHTANEVGDLPEWAFSWLEAFPEDNDWTTTPCFIPAEIWSALERGKITEDGYRSYVWDYEAYDDLNRTCLKYGRRLNDLPEIGGAL